MWPRPGGQWSPPSPSTVTEIEHGEPLTPPSGLLDRPNEILMAHTPAPTPGPLCCGQSFMTSGSYIASQPSFVSTMLQYQPPFQMQLEPVAEQSSRSCQRNQRGTQRQQPYRLPSHNQNVYSRAALPPLRDDLEESDHFGSSAKRQSRITLVCTNCNEPMPIHDIYETSLLEDDAEDPPRILDQWVQTNETQSMWQLEETTILIYDYSVQSNDSRSVSEMGDEAENSLSLVSPSQSPVFPLLSNSVTDSNPLTISIPLTVSVDPNCTEAVTNPPTPIPNSSITVMDSLASSSNQISEASQNLLGSHSPISDGKHLLLTDNLNSELSNHDRSFGVCSTHCAPDSDSDLSPIVSYRLCARSMPVMPAPSAHDRQVANRVIKHARENKIPDERSLWCPDCGCLPVLPVTGCCGHTRCTKCIQQYGICPCGAEAPKSLHVNTLIQDLIKKMLPDDTTDRKTTRALRTASRGEQQRGTVYNSPCSFVPVNARQVAWRQRQANGPQGSLLISTATRFDVAPRTPMSPQSRLELARELIAAGRFREAAPHLARVAASSEPSARSARTLLAQTIAVLSDGHDPRRVTRDLFRAVRVQAAALWLRPADLECVLCYHTYTTPVTTPCGHTYCRTCVERSMDYRKSCALCMRSLDDFNLLETRETSFISACLTSIDALNPPLVPDPDVIPIFVCTVAYPTIPCPLFMVDPRYWLMIRRVLESGSRKFGMVAYERGRTYSDYGTILEVRDCVHFEDGRSILSTVGVSRFRVIERDVRDGCDVARIQPLTDVAPTDELVIWDLRVLAAQIWYKASVWYSSMDRAVRSEIETAFGQLPHFDHREKDWWKSSDGPAWLWWLIAILPLRSEITVLILSTKNLPKRMMAVSRTLEAIDQMALTNPSTTECELQSALTSSALRWLE